MGRRMLVCKVVGVIGLAALCTPVLGQLPECTIDFEGACPNLDECGAAFVGGDGCIFAGLTNCYSSGEFSYGVSPGTPLTITLSDDLDALDVFFVHQGSTSSGEMRFFDATVGGNEVGAPLTTNGNCALGAMPPFQTRSFSTGIRRIEVTAASGTLWIDDFRVNPPPSCAGVGFCSGHGACVAPDVCDCDPGFTGVDCSQEIVPTVSHWGLSAMTLLLLTAGTMALRKRGLALRVR